jgi:C1A family cysteine protease
MAPLPARAAKPANQDAVAGERGRGPDKAGYRTRLSSPREVLNQSIMRPDPETLREWMDQHARAPKAHLDPRLEFAAVQATSLSLLDYLQYVPEERQQGSCGNCWNWAGTGVLEIALNKQAGIKDRLSTQYLNSCKADRFACCGGMLSMFAEWYAGQGLAVPWSNTNADFRDANTTCEQASALACNQVATEPRYPITSIQNVALSVYGVGQATAIANIKNVLNQGKAIWFGFFLPDFNPFFDFWSGANASEDAIWNPDIACGATKMDGGHAVLLVGYDDTGPEPYWIMLNSWGTADGKRPHGLFRVKQKVNYDCKLTTGGEQYNTLLFETLDVSFANTSTCTYTLTPARRDFGNGGGSDTIVVNTATDCDWSATPSASWIRVTSGGAGPGDGTIQYTVDPNNAISARTRTGTITVGNKTFAITQEGDSTLPESILLNGGFEQGETAWDQYSSGNYRLIYEYYQKAHSGDWFAFLAGEDNLDEYIAQELTIPANATAAEVQFWYQIDTTEYDGGDYDFLALQVLPQNQTQPESLGWLSNQAHGTEYAQTIAVDLGPYIGRTVTLLLHAQTDSSLPTSFFIDDVTLNVSYPVGETITSPNAPTGPAAGAPGVALSFSAEGGSSSLGHAIEYSLDWGDGTGSAWGPGTGVGKSWPSAGTYCTKARARCVQHPDVVSDWSPCLSVTISGGGGSALATRALPAGYVPSTPVAVSIAVTPATSTANYAVEDIPPGGWKASEISDGGVWDNVNKKVKFGPFFDHNPRTLTYNATPPPGESGEKYFAGVASFDGSNVPIGGTASISPGANAHPADTNGDMRLTIDEVTAYGAAWKTGAAWPKPPTPIPIEYVTNAGYIWKSGEVYRYDGSKIPPFTP